MSNVTDNNDNTGMKGLLNKKWFPAVVLVVIFVVVAGIIFFFPKGDDNDGGQNTPAETPSSSSTTPSTSTSSGPSNSDSPSSTESSSPNENGSSSSSSGPSSDPEPDTQNAPPPEEGIGTTDKPAFVNGVPYAQTDEAIKDWTPVQSTFLQGLLGSGNILEKVKSVSSPAVQKKLEGVAAGAYKDELDLDGEHMYEEVATSFRLVQTYDTKSGKKVSMTIEYVFDGTNPGKWLVTDYSVK